MLTPLNSRLWKRNRTDALTHFVRRGIFWNTSTIQLEWIWAITTVIFLCNSGDRIPVRSTSALRPRPYFFYTLFGEQANACLKSWTQITAFLPFPSFLCFIIVAPEIHPCWPDQGVPNEDSIPPGQKACFPSIACLRYHIPSLWWLVGSGHLSSILFHLCFKNMSYMHTSLSSCYNTLLLLCTPPPLALLKVVLPT